MANILLVRHGETDWNRAKRLQGHLDISLNQEGITQANRLGKSLVNEPIDIAYSSDLSRAFDTAQAILAQRSIPHFIDQSLRERCYGEIQGMTYAQIEAELPDNHRAWHSRDPDFQPKNGESLRQFYQRVEAGMLQIAKAHLGQTILVVAHGGILDCMFRLASGISIEDQMKVDLLNTSLNRLQYDGQKFQIKTWADLSHLENQSALDEIDRT
ncbi:MAG: histidine phosphatase family protein [Polynucleobacter sp.]|jgi:probable phosphoglycerate mutase|nr:histidine phosphatase family protein [Polynucleobacter sp.]